MSFLTCARPPEYELEDGEIMYRRPSVFQWTLAKPRLPAADFAMAGARAPARARAKVTDDMKIR